MEIQVSVFRDVTLYVGVVGSLTFRGPCCLCLQGEYLGSMDLDRNTMRQRRAEDRALSFGV